MTTSETERRMSARLTLIDEHIRLENEHNLDGIA